MIRLILTFMLSALAFASMGANDCVTPTQAYDSRGGLVWEMLPDVYGEVMECRGDRTLVPFRHQGQYEDAETGLYYNRFRYYSHERGMYISSDPIGLAGNNPTLYGYVQDVNIFLDWLGLELIKNKADGLERESIVGDWLRKNNPDATVLSERYLRDSFGKSVIADVKTTRVDIDLQTGTITCG